MLLRRASEMNDRFARPILLGALSCMMLACPACRTSSVGFPVAMVGDAVTEIDARQRQRSLLGLPLRDADALFGAPSESFHNLDTGAHYVSFNTSGMLGKQNFYMVQVSPQDRVLDVQQWIEWHDGFEDTAKLAWVKPKT